MKRALVLEGGAMRAIYTAGVLDVFMEAGLEFDAIIGVSAGALFGVNYLSRQKGRVLRYSSRFNPDRNYMGILPLLRTGDIVDPNYAYVRVPYELDPFDDEAYRRSSVPFYAVVTNMQTGRPEYRRIFSVLEQMEELRASGSMPLVSRPVPLQGGLYLDGAVSDSIPFEHMLEEGFDRLVVVCTRCEGQMKKPMPALLTRLMYGRKYPAFASLMLTLHRRYEEQRARLRVLERQGVADVLRPSRLIAIRRIERKVETLRAMYDLGTGDALAYLARGK